MTDPTDLQPCPKCGTTHDSGSLERAICSLAAAVAEATGVPFSIALEAADADGRALFGQVVDEMSAELLIGSGDDGTTWADPTFVGVEQPARLNTVVRSPLIMPDGVEPFDALAWNAHARENFEALARSAVVTPPTQT